MALKDFTYEKDGTTHNFFYWYEAADVGTDGNGITDYSITTKSEFGKGKTNTSNMITKWNGRAYGAQVTEGMFLDMWGVIQGEVNKGWFVPSRAEWSAFVKELGITSADYSNFGLNDYYWSSSLGDERNAWLAFLSDGFTWHFRINEYNSVRLSATF